MSLSDVEKATARSKPTIWREIRATLSKTRDAPQWLASGPRRSRRRLCRLLLAELLHDERTSAR